MSSLAHPPAVVTSGTLVAPDGTDAALGAAVIAHLEAQLASAGRLLSIVLEQGAAIRARDVQAVVTGAGLMQAELQRRALVDRERGRLLSQAGARLGIDPAAVTLELLSGLMDPESARTAREHSAQLRGLLEQVRTEHHVNRALMHQELRFLDHLLRIADSEHQVGYDAAGDPTRTSGAGARHRTLDLEV